MTPETVWGQVHGGEEEKPVCLSKTESHKFGHKGGSDVWLPQLNWIKTESSPLQLVFAAVDFFFLISLQGLEFIQMG